MKNRRGQLTIFVIIALIIIAAIVGYFLLKDKVFPSAVPSNLMPAYEKYISCLEQTASDGARIMGSQGGYIDLPSFEPGTTYSPFSNQLDFMGMGVPYWYYISGNGIKKEQLPSKGMMESALAEYVKENALKNCDFAEFTSIGYNISFQDSSRASVRTSIEDNEITMAISQQVSISRGEESSIISSHTTQIDSRLGKLYDSAKKIYNYEKDNSFLETYSRDVLYTYAPVEGMLLNCSPAIWSPHAVFSDLRNALSANLGLVKVNSDSYVTRNSYSNYFVVGKNNNNMKLEGEQASFLYSPDWTGRFEVWPTKNNVMSAEPIGTQPGLGAMGFCYIPYKFVYDMYFPVLVQVYNPSNAEDVFQFAYAVVISKNAAREAMQSPEYSPPEESMCEKANQEITVNTYGSNLEAVEADIEIKCLNDACSLGRTEFDNSTGIASLKVMAPQCLNSIITASSAGYKDTTEIISTNTEAFVDIVMEKENTLGLEIYVDGNLINSDMSLLSINEMSNNLSFPSQTIAYPFKKEISLGEGDYNFDLKVFKNGNILVPSTTTRQCVKVPQTGVLGFFGLEDEKCTDITIPAQTLNNVLYAGGTLNQYITRSELQNARTMKVFAQSITLPSSAEEIGSNYDEIAGKTIYLELV